MKIKNREKVLLLGAALVVGLLVLDRLVVTPLTRAWKERSEKIVSLTKSLNNGQVLLTRERDVRTRWAGMVSNTLPDNVSMGESIVLKAVDRWVQASQIGFTSIKPQWKQNDEDYMTLECRVDAFGGMEALTRFLYEMETDPLAVKVEDLEITARDTAGQQLSLGVRFTGLMLTSDKK